MGIDLKRKHVKKSIRREPDSQDPYLRLLVKLYRFLARRTGSSFNQVVLKRLCMSRVNRPPVSLSKIVSLGGATHEGRIVVVIGSITNDERLLEVPKLQVCALRFSEAARDRILKAGGRALTLDQLALERPTGTNTLLVQGRRHAREATKHFRGLHGKHAKPYTRSEGKMNRNKHGNEKGKIRVKH